jgi:alpha-tubulin suppressor-like RCC1 family protein
MRAIGVRILAGAGVGCLLSSASLAGLPTETARPPAETARAVGLVSGSNHVCALLDDSAVVCWGSNYYSQLGTDGEKFHRALRPRPLEGLGDVTALAAGQGQTCALTRAGKVSCLGSQFHGEVGDGIAHMGSVTAAPTEVRGLGRVVQLAAGTITTCAIEEDGPTQCWGRWPSWTTDVLNPGGRSRPGRVDARKDAAQIGVGSTLACIRRRDGETDCVAEELTKATVIYGQEPPSVRGRLAAVDVAAGDEFACVVRKSGEVACRGTNRHGQLGGANDVVISRWQWTPIAGIRDAVRIAAGSVHVCAVTADGQLYCWGNDVRCQLGGGTVTGPAHPTPVKVAGLPPVTAAALGWLHSCALTRTGEIWCWGENDAGQLADGTTKSSCVPRRVPLPPRTAKP